VTGERVLQSMVWGFPLRLKGMKPDSKPRPVNNIADLSKPMWIGLARKPRRAVSIPLTGFAGVKAGVWGAGQFQLQPGPVGLGTSTDFGTLPPPMRGP
jgi:hypothetical protein